MIHSYPWYIQEWLGSDSRASLSMEERGLYRDLLDLLYNEGGSLPIEEGMLCRKAQCTEREWKRSWPKVRPRFYESEGRLRSRKADDTLAKLAGYRDRRSAAGRLGAEKTNRQKRGSAEDLPQQNSGNAEFLSQQKVARINLNPTSTQPQPQPQPSAAALPLEGEFLEFKKTAAARDVLRGSEQDWRWALSAWRTLDFEQRQRAQTDLETRPEDTPELRSLPHNYLKERKFTRPMPKTQVRESAAQERLRNA